MAFSTGAYVHIWLMKTKRPVSAAICVNSTFIALLGDTVLVHGPASTTCMPSDWKGGCRPTVGKIRAVAIDLRGPSQGCALRFLKVSIHEDLPQMHPMASVICMCIGGRGDGFHRGRESVVVADEG